MFWSKRVRWIIFHMMTLILASATGYYIALLVSQIDRGYLLSTGGLMIGGLVFSTVQYLYLPNEAKTHSGSWTIWNTVAFGIGLFAAISFTWVFTFDLLINEIFVPESASQVLMWGIFTGVIVGSMIGMGMGAVQSFLLDHQYPYRKYWIQSFVLSCMILCAVITGILYRMWVFILWERIQHAGEI